MKKSIPSFMAGLFCGAILLGGSMAYASGVATIPFSETGQHITLNGEPIELTGYMINGNNYFKLRDIGEKLEFGVTWNGTTHTVEITTEHPVAINDHRVELPADGSCYVPKVGDVIRCSDGTDYTIKDVSRWDKNAFSAGPLGPLPTEACDWSSFPEVALPAVEVRHINNSAGDYLFVRNLYESRRMQYTIQNLAGNHPDTSANGKLRYGSKGTPYVRIQLTIDDTTQAQSFWPWRASELEKQFESCPLGLYAMEAWDVYRNGVFLYTEYMIYAQ